MNDQTATVDPQVEEMKAAAATETQKKFKDPYEFLASIPNAPSKIVIEDWKSRTPNRQLKVFTPDKGKRVYIVRAVGALELQKLQEALPSNTPDSRREYELQFSVATACCVWTNAGTASGNRLADQDLKGGAAGLPVTLYQLVSWLSDFVDPEALGFLSADL